MFTSEAKSGSDRRADFYRCHAGSAVGHEDCREDTAPATTQGGKSVRKLRRWASAPFKAAGIGCVFGGLLFFAASFAIEGD